MVHGAGGGGVVGGTGVSEGNGLGVMVCVGLGRGVAVSVGRVVGVGVGVGWTAVNPQPRLAINRATSARLAKNIVGR